MTPGSISAAQVALDRPVNGDFDPLVLPYTRRGDTVPIHGRRFWTYHTPDGLPYAWVVEFSDTELIPLRFVDGKPRWIGWSKPHPKPIYNQHLLANHDKPILILDSEAAADAASKLFPDHTCISWFGGPKSVSLVDWHPVIPPADSDPSATYPDGTPVNPDHTVRIWPANSKPARDAALYLKSRIPTAHIVRVSNLPPDWSLARLPPPGSNLNALLLSYEDPAPENQPDPFVPLGSDDDGYHYHSKLSGRIISLNPSEHTELNLQQIADDAHWISKGFHGKSGIDYKAVAKHLLHVQHRTGQYNPDLIRGRGAWIDSGHLIFHAGDRIHSFPSPQPVSRFQYPARPPIQFQPCDPASVDQARRFIDLCELLPWGDNQQSWAFPALCFIAVICGILPFRPGLWLIGEKGTGKSWTYSNILAAYLSGFALKFVSNTTEAGIRQSLLCDALAVLFDEIESKDESAIARIARVLELFRQSASETGGRIVKGSPTGRAHSYQIRSSFFLSSIATAALEPADESRLVILKLVKPTNPALQRERFDRLKSELNHTLRNPAWLASMHSRALHLGSSILASIPVFQRAIEVHANDARKADLHAPIAAAFWFLQSDTPPTPAEANAWADATPWDTTSAVESDSSRSLTHLLQAKHHYQTNNGTRYDAPVEEIIRMFYSGEPGSTSQARSALALLGLHPTAYGVHIPCTHAELARIYRHTHFQAGWAPHLETLPDAKPSCYKLAGRSIKSVLVSKDAILGQGG